MKNIAKNEVVDFLKDLVIIIAVVLVCRLFIFDPFKVIGHSMDSTLYNGEYIIIDKFSYLDLPIIWEVRGIKRWDIVVFKPHIDDQKKYYIKRVIWLPGDKLKIENWEVFLMESGETEYKKINEPYLNVNNLGRTFIRWDESKVWEYEVPAWEYFMMGDNRNGSTDSRECFRSCSLSNINEYVPEDYIKWRLILDMGYFSFDKMAFLNESGEDSFPRFFNLSKTWNYTYE